MIQSSQKISAYLKKGQVLTIALCASLISSVVFGQANRATTCEREINSELVNKEDKPSDGLVAFVGDKTAGTLHRVKLDTPVRKCVKLQVYLPPTWDLNKAGGYPVVYFLHGNPGYEDVYFEQVEHHVFNQWIEQEALPAFVVVTLNSHDNSIEGGVNWSTPNNVELLTSEADGYLRAFVKKAYNAGHQRNQVVVTGNSMGAHGAMYLALSHPQAFSAAVGNAYVTESLNKQLQQVAQSNLKNIIAQDIKIRITIGDQDPYYLDNNRAAETLHNDLTLFGIKHEFEVLREGGHPLSSTWGIMTRSGVINGLHEYKFFTQQWNKTQ